MTVVRAFSCCNLPSPGRLNNIDVSDVMASSLDIESEMLIRAGNNSDDGIEMNLMLLNEVDEKVTGDYEWRIALQNALVEKQKLSTLLRKYQKLVRTYREQDFTRFSHSLDISFRRRASTDRDTIYRSQCREHAVETDKYNTVNEAFDYDEVVTAEDGDSHDFREEQLGIESRHRRPSKSSSFLYAGVDSIAPIPSPQPPILEEKDTITIQDNAKLIVLSPLTKLTQGCWLYKYPRRQYTKLIIQSSIPSNQLHYRYFWLQPFRSCLCWSIEPGSTVLKQVQIVDFYTEARLLPKEREDDQQLSATIIILLTEQENPLALVPTTNEELTIWIEGLVMLLKLKQNNRWPQNVSICTI